MIKGLIVAVASYLALASPVQSFASFENSRPQKMARAITPFNPMDQKERQEKANRASKVKYLTLNPLLLEGPRVIAIIRLRDKVGGNSYRVPLRITFSFTLTKEAGRWTIEDSAVYSAKSFTTHSDTQNFA